MSTSASQLDMLSASSPIQAAGPLHVSAAEIEAAKTPRDGWTAKTLQQWGVPWPPPKGWRQQLIARTFVPPTASDRAVKP